MSSLSNDAKAPVTMEVGKLCSAYFSLVNVLPNLLWRCSATTWLSLGVFAVMPGVPCPPTGSPAGLTFGTSPAVRTPLSWASSSSSSSSSFSPSTPPSSSFLPLSPLPPSRLPPPSLLRCFPSSSFFYSLLPSPTMHHLLLQHLLLLGISDLLTFHQMKGGLDNSLSPKLLLASLSSRQSPAGLALS